MQALHSERLIDVPIESLPFVDEHSTTVDASLDATWDALLETCSRLGHGAGAPVARALGCEHAERRGPPGRIGSTIPGFVVARSVAPCVLALMGAHRFSVYALVFRLTEAGADRVQLGAETRAEFPGAAGRAYRIAVIGSHGHVVATRSILRAVRRRAEGSPPRRSPLRSRPGSAD